MELNKKYILMLGKKVVATDEVDFAREFLEMTIPKAVQVQIEAKPLVEATPTAKEAEKTPEAKREKPKKKVSPRGERTYTDNGGGYTITTTTGGTTTISKKAVDVTRQVINAIYEETGKPAMYKSIETRVNAIRKQSRTSTNRAIDVLVEVTHELKHVGAGRASAYIPIDVTAGAPMAPVNNEAAAMPSSVRVVPNKHGGFNVQSGKTETSVSGTATDLVEKAIAKAYEDNGGKPVSPKDVSGTMRTSFQHRVTPATISLALLVLRERGRVKAFKVGKRAYVYVPTRTTRAIEEDATRKEVPVVPAADAKREEEVTKSIQEEKHTLIRSLDKP